ncbi:MAG: TolC family protein [Deltaproteobacteria bacterium]|nr:TolC family protein [Deltaproteobacteria bacterium]
MKNQFVPSALLLAAQFLVALPPAVRAQSLPPLSFEAAWERVLRNHPTIEAAEHGIRAAEARERQAALMPNPEVSVEVENVLGSSPMSRLREAETTFQYSQALEIWGSRDRRTRAAALETEIIRREREAGLAELLYDTRRGFISVAAAEERLALVEQQVQAIERSVQAASRRVTAGRSSPVELLRLQVALAGSRIALESARKTLDGTRQSLALLWGGTEPDFSRTEGTFAEIPRLPDFAAIAGQLENTAGLRRADAESSAISGQIELEAVRWKPVPSGSIGIRHLNGPNAVALVGGIAFPLPVLNRNQESIRALRETLLQTEAARNALRISLLQELRRWWTEATIAHGEAETIRAQALPQVASALEESRRRYETGAGSYMELLDTNQTWFDLHSRYLDALTSCHLAIAALERPFTGGISAGSAHP